MSASLDSTKQSRDYPAQANRKRSASGSKSTVDMRHLSASGAASASVMGSTDDESLLPSGKRVSPMPDFSTYSSEPSPELASAPWIAVRQMAERMPSRRSSALAPPLSPEQPHRKRPSLNHRGSGNSVPSVRSSSHNYKDSNLSVPDSQLSSPAATRQPPRSSGANTWSRRASRSVEDISPPVRPLMPRTRSQEVAFDAPVSPTLPSASKPAPLRSAMKPLKTAVASPVLSPKSTAARTQVEDAVRELQEFVDAKRGTTSFDTVRSGTTVAASENRSTVGPGLMVRTSTSRPVSDATLSSLSTSRPPSRMHSSRPKLMQRWKMRTPLSTATETPQDNSGTFFLGGGPQSRPTSPTRGGDRDHRTDGAESPTDKHWTLDRPYSEFLSFADDAFASLGRENSSRAARREQTNTWTSGAGRLSRSSSIAVANPISHLSSIASVRSDANAPDTDQRDSVVSFSFIDGARRPSTNLVPDSPVSPMRSYTNYAPPNAGAGGMALLRTISLSTTRSRDDSSVASSHHRQHIYNHAHKQQHRRSWSNGSTSATSARRPGGATALATVGEFAPASAGAAEPRGVTARRLWEMERELEAVQMERGLARLSQVGVAY